MERTTEEIKVPTGTKYLNFACISFHQDQTKL